MVRLLRIVGFLSILLGALFILAWLIKPLRFLWPWITRLPWPVQVGLAAVLGGLLLLVGSLIWERMGEREQGRELRDDEP